MSNEDIEKLEAEYQEMLKEKVSAMKAEKEAKLKAQKEKEEQEKYEAMKANLTNEIKEDLLKSFNKEVDDANDGSESGIDEPGNSGSDTPLNAGETKVPELYKMCANEVKFTAKKAGLGTINGIPSYSDKNLMDAYVKMGMEAFSATNSDSSCEDDVSAWENEDYFVDTIWFDIICSSDFLGKIGHRKYDYQAGAGGQVQIKEINIPSPAHDWGNAASLDPCECIDCVSNAFTTYTVQIKKYGDMREICNADLLLAGNEVQSAVLETMKIRLAERIDNEIWSNLSGATPGSTVTSDITCSQASRGTDGDCCTYTINLFDDILDLHDTMWNAGYFRKSNPVLIINKTVSAYLKYKDGMNIPAYMQSALKFEGTKLTGIGEIQVIESCHAPTCASAGAGAVIAVLVDPSRAFAEVWGQKPKYESDRNIDCDSTTYVVWAYAAFDVLDTGAIGHLVNP